MPSTSTTYKPTVAIAGAKGLLGKPTIEAITSSTFRDNFTLPLIVITRNVDSSTSSTSDVKYVEASDLKSYETALKGVDILVDLRSVVALSKPDLVLAAKNSGVKLYIPSDFGSDYYKVGKYKAAFKPKVDNAALAKKQEGLKVVQIHTGYFIDTAFQPVVSQIIFLNRIKGVADYVDGSTTVTLTSIKNIGQTVASVISHEPSEIPDVIHVNPNNISLSEIADLYEKYSGEKLQREPTTVESLQHAADQTLVGGSFAPTAEYGFLDILRVISATSDGSNFAKEDQTEFVNPGGKLFKWETADEYAAKLFKK